jgi:hypothetical protein
MGNISMQETVFFINVGTVFPLPRNSFPDFSDPAKAPCLIDSAFNQFRDPIGKFAQKERVAWH